MKKIVLVAASITFIPAVPSGLAQDLVTPGKLTVGSSIQNTQLAADIGGLKVTKHGSNPEVSLGSGILTAGELQATSATLSSKLKLSGTAGTISSSVNPDYLGFDGFRPDGEYLEIAMGPYEHPLVGDGLAFSSYKYGAAEQMAYSFLDEGFEPFAVFKTGSGLHRTLTMYNSGIEKIKLDATIGKITINGQDVLTRGAGTALSGVLLGVGSSAPGAHSLALGYGNVAAGNYSITAGYNTYAGQFSTAFGEGSRAEIYGDLAAGWFTKATGGQSVALGNVTWAAGQMSTALGWGSTANGFGSVAAGVRASTGSATSPGFYDGGMSGTGPGVGAVAIGYETKALSTGSVALGYAASSSGTYSFAAGPWASAEGGSSVSVGYFNRAIGGNSFATGHRSEAWGLESFVSGRGNKANGMASFAGGWDSIAGGTYSANEQDPYGTAAGGFSFAFGQSARASGRAAVSMGHENTASHFASTSLGYRNQASGYISASVGMENAAIGDASVSIGNHSNSMSNSSVALGLMNRTWRVGQTTVGRWSTNAPGPVSPSAVSYQPTDEVFVVGGGSAENARSNALVVRANGTVEATGSVSAAGATFRQPVILEGLGVAGDIPMYSGD